MRNYRKARHLMLDIETWDTLPTACVWQIGAAAMDFQFDDAEPIHLEVTLDLQDQIEQGRTQGDSTTAWWQDPKQAAARAYIEAQPVLPVVEALERVRGAVLRFQPDYVWCQGASFDFPILVNLFSMYGIEVPWKFWQERDSRTVIGGTSPDVRKQIWDENPELVPHASASDAIVQLRAIRYLVNI